jgi:hypothetical protein
MPTAHLAIVDGDGKKKGKEKKVRTLFTYSRFTLIINNKPTVPTHTLPFFILL